MSTTASPGSRAARVGHVPGEAGLWILLIGDMTVFGVFFTAFLVQRRSDPEMFSHSRASLMVDMGAINTLVLLTSSLFVARAVRAHRDSHRVAAGRWVVGAQICALIFVALKAVEWGIEIHGGHNPAENLFFTYYFALTGIHLLHLVIGSAVLVFWSRLMRRPSRPWDERRVVECCASYWHMVDLLWVVIFPVLYLSAG